MAVSFFVAAAVLFFSLPLSDSLLCCHLVLSPTQQGVRQRQRDDSFRLHPSRHRRKTPHFPFISRKYNNKPKI